MEKSKENDTKLLEKVSVRVTRFIGTPASIILHTFFFVAVFALKFFGVDIGQILLILTTAVSLEAIYLSIFIQMTVNRHEETLEAVEDDIEDIQEDVEDISEDIKAKSKSEKPGHGMISSLFRFGSGNRH